MSVARFSTDMQDSVEDQHDDNEETAADHGLAIIARCGDEGVSRSTPLADRSGFQEAMSYLRRGEAKAIVCTMTNRVIGEPRQLYAFLDELRALGARLFSYDGEEIFETEDDLTKLEEKTHQSAEALRNIRTATRRGLRAKNRGNKFTGRPPFGLRIKPLPEGAPLVVNGRIQTTGELDHDPIEFKWLVKIFEWAGDEGVTPFNIAKRLSGKVATKNGNMGWSGLGVQRIIRNRIYLGEREWGRKRTVRWAGKKSWIKREDGDRDLLLSLTTNLGPVIDPDLWQRANDAMDARTYNRGTSAANRMFAPRDLDGWVWCDRCGLKMHAKRDRKILANGERTNTWRYLCSNRMKVGPRVTKTGELRHYCERYHQIAERHLFAALTGETLKGEQANVVVTGRYRDDPTLAAELDVIEKALTQADDEVAWVLAEARKKPALRATFDRELEQIDTENKMNRTRRDEIKAQLARQAGDRRAEAEQAMTFLQEQLALVWHNPNIPQPEKQALLNRFVVRIWVDAPNIYVELRNPPA